MMNTPAKNENENKSTGDSKFLAGLPKIEKAHDELKTEPNAKETGKISPKKPDEAHASEDSYSQIDITKPGAETSVE